MTIHFDDFNNYNLLLYIVYYNRLFQYVFLNDDKLHKIFPFITKSV